jgi:hypothetical protein
MEAGSNIIELEYRGLVTAACQGQHGKQFLCMKGVLNILNIQSDMLLYQSISCIYCIPPNFKSLPQQEILLT